jgi:hypothetical protein
MTNERDDEILGRALSRAIETIDAEETPYESSRVAAQATRRGTPFWRVAALAASIVLAGALGSTLLERPATDQPVGVQPSATVGPANTQAATATPAATTAPKATAIDRDRIYFARDGLPPVGVHADKAQSDGPADKRVALRIAQSLIEDPGVRPPTGAFDARPPRGVVTTVAGITINGDVATVDLTVPSGWKVSGSAATTALIQQIVYTATEEPGIRRVLITENGGKPTTIDQFVWTKPLAREDVAGYSKADSGVVTAEGAGTSTACLAPCPSPSTIRLSNTYSVDSVAPGVARFVVQVESGQLRDWDIRVEADNDAPPAWGSKAVMHLQVAGRDVKPGLEIIDRSPIRAINATALAESSTYEVTLDDLRPWRVVVLSNPDRIVVDFGGYPAAISDTVAVYSPKPGDTGRQFTVSGLSRTFEATTHWRVVDSARRELASGFTTASRGTSAVWGTYQISVQLPATVSGNVTLEVFWASPRDGADTGLVQVPLTVR